MRLTLSDGLVVDVDLRLGFVVHNQDGTSEQLIHLDNPRIVGGTPPDGPGEPLPEPKSA